MKNAVVVVDPDIRVNQEIVLGFSEELQRHDSWDIHVMSPAGNGRKLKQAIRAITPDAVAVRSHDAGLVAYLQSQSIPWVSVAVDGPAADHASVVVPDDAAMGKMAAEHLLAQRFEHFALVNFETPASGRGGVFCRVIEQSRRSPTVHRFVLAPMGDHPFGVYGDPRELVRWLRSLPKPCAVFAHSDQPGAYLIRTCGRNGIRVPEDISVLGVDDDPLFCHTVSPNLASVHIPNKRIGIEAARMVLDWKPGRRLQTVPPTTVVERASCRPPRRADPLVDIALAYLREEVAKGVRVRDLQRLTGLSPHQLVYRFNLVTGRTPMALILQHRITVAKRLLAETSESVKTVASKSGFNSATQFYVTFRNQVGMPPRDYREQFAP